MPKSAVGDLARRNQFSTRRDHAAHCFSFLLFPLPPARGRASDALDDSGKKGGKKGRNFKERTKRSPGDGLSGDLFKVPRPFDNQRAAIVTPGFEERWGRSEKGTKRGWGTMEEDPGLHTAKRARSSPPSSSLSFLPCLSFSLVSRTACPEEKKSPMEIRDFKGHAIPRSKLKKDRENRGETGNLHHCAELSSFRFLKFGEI